MIVMIEPGGARPDSLEPAIHFAQQLSNRGVEVILPAGALPDKPPRLLRYECARWLRDESTVAPDVVVVLNAHEVAAPALARLQLVYAQRSPKLVAIGRFSGRQAQINVQAKIAYAAGIEPVLLDLTEMQPAPLIRDSRYLLMGDQPPVARAFPERPALTLAILDDAFELPHFDGLLGMIVHDPKIKCTLVVSSSNLKQVTKMTARRVRVLSYGDAQPHVIAAQTDVLAVIGKTSPGGRLAALAMDTLMRGGVVIDATKAGGYTQSDAPVLRAPYDFAGLIAFLNSSVLPSLQDISRAVADSPWSAGNMLQPVLDRIFGDTAHEAQTPGAVAAPSEGERQGAKTASASRTVLFLPTNGVGLGHAQRSALIAAELDGTRASAAFAAFPSCVPMLRRAGIATTPLVSRTDVHSMGDAHDILNYLRLKDALQPGDHLVFDGGYVYESVLRVIREQGLTASWIRRGLWQPGQIEKTPLEREHDFTNVIVPEEVFPELNAAYSHGAHIHRVSPVVQLKPVSESERALFRSRLIGRFNPEARKILVTMLGGGVAADREQQLQSLCALCEGRTDWVHLIVAWPHGKLSPAVSGWKNSFVVRSEAAVTLAQVSDLVVSAVGYNSFHELTYHGVPAIFVPQMAGFMDDQLTRAQASAKRGLSVVIDEPENLFTLRRHVTELMEDGATAAMKSAFSDLDLPEIGNSAAARIIEGAMT